MNRGLIEAPYYPLTRARVKRILPRFMNRGLIEACWFRRGRAFESELPRFMNRGLIEARSAAERKLAILDYFPDS